MTDDPYDPNSEARSRHRRAVLTILIVLLMLFFAAWYAMSYVRADQARRESSPSSSTTTAECIEPADVTVNVYNATNRAGLAADVATDLRTRGFMVKTVANDPKRAQLTGPGELRYGQLGAKGAELVAAHVGTFEREVDERERPSVDVVLGQAFDSLVPISDVAAC